MLNTIGFNMVVLWWWEGEWSPPHFKLQQHHDGIVRVVVRNERVSLQQTIADSVVVVVPVMSVLMAGGGW